LDEFDLPVKYKGEEQIFKASLVTFGHTHKFHVDVNCQTVIFEPDEERNYRAVKPYEEINSGKNEIDDKVVYNKKRNKFLDDSAVIERQIEKVEIKLSNPENFINYSIKLSSKLNTM